MASNRGVWATKISLAALLATALVQSVIVSFTGSVALLADTIPTLATQPPRYHCGPRLRCPGSWPNKRFNYAYGQAEDLAEPLIVVSILATGIYVGYESITRLSNPPEIDYIWVVAVAAIIGFISN